MLSYNTVLQCPTPSGCCRTTCLVKGITTMIYGCVGGFPTTCTYAAREYTDWGTFFPGLCNEADQYVLIGPTPIECSDAKMCLIP